jgi:hypothetical protein
VNYIVTHEEDEELAMDLGDGTRAFDLAGALAFARTLIAGGKALVVIDDGNGHRITGAELEACCAGQKTLTDDLRAV